MLAHCQTCDMIMYVLSRVFKDVRKYLSSAVEIWIAFGKTRAVFSFVIWMISLNCIIIYKQFDNKTTYNCDYMSKQYATFVMPTRRNDVFPNVTCGWYCQLKMTSVQCKLGQPVRRSQIAYWVMSRYLIWSTSAAITNSILGNKLLRNWVNQCSDHK